MENSKFIALYERLSHDDELQGESNSISHQKLILEEYAVSHGLSPYRHFTDDGISGTRFDRPGFLAMMEEINNGNVSNVIVKDMSRLGRDYLKVGQLMEMFRQKDIVLIAINDGVDTSRDDDDFIPFRNIMNEWYAKDTSRKLKSVFQAKGRSGKHVGGTPPYGYLKDSDDPTHWVVDEEAAAVIRRIFKLAIDGLGTYQIAKILKQDEIDIPGVHLQKLGLGLHRSRKMPNPYNWNSSTVADILERREYLGHTVNFKTRKHMKDSHSHYVDDDLWVVFENTQEPIIDKETFECVQNIRANATSWTNGFGSPHPLSGLMYCADCGGKMYVDRFSNNTPVAKFSCYNYHKKNCPSEHRVDADEVMILISRTLQSIWEYMNIDRKAFAEELRKEAEVQRPVDDRPIRKQIREDENRCAELKKLLCRIYEDNILGKLPDSRYESLSKQYETELSSLQDRLKSNCDALSEQKDSADDITRFIKLIDKYGKFETLTAEIINDLIDRIVVHERTVKYSQTGPNQIDIYFKFAGDFKTLGSKLETETAAMTEEAARHEEHRKKCHDYYLKSKADGSWQKWEEGYAPIRANRKATKKAACIDLQRQSAGRMSKAEYTVMRRQTRTAQDIPEGILSGYILPSEINKGAEF